MKAISASIIVLAGAVLLITNRYELIGLVVGAIGLLAWAFLTFGRFNAKNDS